VRVDLLQPQHGGLFRPLRPRRPARRAVQRLVQQPLVLAPREDELRVREQQEPPDLLGLLREAIQRRGHVAAQHGRDEREHPVRAVVAEHAHDAAAVVPQRLVNI